MTMNAADLRQTVGELIEVLAGAVDDNNNTVIRDYLTFMGRFHKYSLNNQLLIWFQRPNATQVAGYKAWQSLGRQVRKGEKGIAILVPMARKVQGDDGAEETKLWFGTGYVFDVSQTDGEPLPEQPDWSSKECAPVLQAKLFEFAKSLGIQVCVGEPTIEGAQGVSYGGKIVIHPDTGTSTLVHELAHELLHQGTDKSASRQVRELQAEAVAAVVMSHFGFEVSESLNYLGLWAVSGDGIKNNMDAIQKAACTIIQAVEGE